MKFQKSITVKCSITLLLAVFFMALPVVRAAAGDVDLSFNTGNIQPTDSSGSIRTIAVQPDGKIIIGGFFITIDGSRRDKIARLNANGSTDTSFNSPIMAFPPSNSGGVKAIAVQPDGKILVGGSFLVNDVQVALVRLNADGSRDSSFAPDVGNTSVDAIVLQSDGKILVGGTFGRVNGTFCSGIARLNSDGSLDSALGSIGGIANFVTTIALQPDGKILLGGNFFVVGTSPLMNNVARLNSDGTLDTTFNVGSGPTNSVFSVAVQSNGKTLVGGTFTSFNGTAQIGLVRLNSNGSIDPSFITGATSGGASGIVLQPDGKIAFVGSFTLNDGTVVRRGFGRLNTDGSIDSFYPSNGIGIGTDSAGIFAIALQTDTKVLIGGGFTTVAGVARTNIARLLNDDPSAGVDTPVGTNVP
ncbi:MAG: delta-60 repeat domain-containing protein, partial [bacterium]|nr:delta-60 repeat domain-containing protein [bacterium]